MLMPSQIQEQSLQEANQMVNQYNRSVKDQNVVDLITNLTSLMLQVKVSAFDHFKSLLNPPSTGKQHLIYHIDVHLVLANEMLCPVFTKSI